MGVPPKKKKKKKTYKQAGYKSDMPITDISGN